MLSRSVQSTTKRGFAAFALGMVALGTPLASFAQTPPPPPPHAMQPPPPGAQPPPPNMQPPPPPPGAQPYPYPYPYPYAQPGQPAYPPYPPPYGYPPGAYGPPQQNLPETLPYKENEPIPPGYKLEQRVRKGLVIPGAIIFGLFYFGSVVVGGSNLDADNAPYGTLFIPVIGPFIMAGTGDFTNSSSGAANISGGTNMLYVFNGLIQAGGGAMLLAGILAKKKILVRENATAVVQPEFFVGPGSVGMKVQF